MAHEQDACGGLKHHWSPRGGSRVCRKAVPAGEERRAVLGSRWRPAGMGVNRKSVDKSTQGIEMALMGPAAALGIWTLLALPSVSRYGRVDAEHIASAKEDLLAAAAAGSLISSILWFGFEHPVGAITTQVAALALFGYGMHTLNSRPGAA